MTEIKHYKLLVGWLNTTYCVNHDLWGTWNESGRGYIEARTDTTQQSGQTQDKEVEIKNITVYVSGYTERPDSRGR